jgi:hypothetical protein
MIQLATAAVVWLPLVLLSGWDGSWTRAWALGDRVRTWVSLAMWATLGLVLLLAFVGDASQRIPGVRNRISTDRAPAVSTADVHVFDASVVKVYDYTTVGTAWTPLIRDTVDEFNAVRPASAPQLVYVTAPGDADCLDITNAAVWDMAGIIICDTRRPEEFPFDPTVPKEGWAGLARQIDDDTHQILLNNFVPNGYVLAAEEADNTVCHEMMHSYVQVGDHYDADVNSCVFGNLLSPGTTDIGLMQERWPAPVAEPARPERVSDGRPEVDRTGCDPAYPDAQTCIPPGPPFNQGCAITNERLFTVLPPDPQRLDHDGDGIGCEPVVSS